MTSNAVTDQEPWWITNYRGHGPVQRYSHHDFTKTRRAIELYTMVVGTLQLSRAVSDRKLAEEVLEQGIGNALTFMKCGR